MKHDLLLAKAEGPTPVAEALIDSGLLTDEYASDQEALGRALVEAAERFIYGGH